MTSQVIPISRLNLEPETVKCPACQHVGKSIRVMETTSNGQATASCLMGILACLACNCGYMTAPTYYFLSHYCSRCGIRFVIVPWYDNPILHLERSLLVDAESTEKGDSGRKIMPSPLGTPPQFNEELLRNFATRFISSTPSLTLEILLQGDRKFPSQATDVASSKKLYDITWPGLAAGDPVEYTPGEPMTATPAKPDSKQIKSMASWDPSKSTPHIRVSTADGVNREVATAQVFATSRDYILHTPTTGPDGVVSYVSRRSGIKGKISSKSGYMVWSSCAGPLAWIVRSVQDKEMQKTSRRIVLMDAYDRLVGIISSTDNEESVRLKIYGDFSSELVGEILASFSAVSYTIWNYSRLEGTDEGWGVAAGAMSVAGLGLALAGI
ncbi:hypothetical protein B0J15DRAFT_502295 [Fusarium solani]|uniref:LITAF domain-containing protein n=1 Tax=Fusarium solani TaxID=169388 RepID=A0A9P9GL45_FUSSL|nr:uncharacterized protein B0J15DRAFT_502295 [Fusarium solani]KAH7240527.1 hypothetical protein B0J15DRAFT_502295 [Fusarium solani]